MGRNLHFGGLANGLSVRELQNHSDHVRWQYFDFYVGFAGSSLYKIYSRKFELLFIRIWNQFDLVWLTLNDWYGLDWYGPI